ncbi:hypothetical protein KY285_027291 [Solanum tuberosum]|nr:hypothetical protein KY285_027291 [Solanum tuberosum]
MEEEEEIDDREMAEGEEVHGIGPLYFFLRLCMFILTFMCEAALKFIMEVESLTLLVAYIHTGGVDQVGIMKNTYIYPVARQVQGNYKKL